MATGDLKNSIRKLQAKLKLINYPKDIDIKGFSKGLAQDYLPLMHYILLDYSTSVAQLIINNDMELYGKNDSRFMAAVYKVFRDIFKYKPYITQQQFFSRGFAEHKILFMIDAIMHVKEKHRELSKLQPGSAHKQMITTSSPARQQASHRNKDLLLAALSGPGQLTSDAPITHQLPPIAPQVLPPVMAEELPPIVAEEPPIGAPMFASMSSHTVMKGHDTGYNTAETSPLPKSPNDLVQPMHPVSVNELRAKFEISPIPKHDSSHSQMNETDLEEHPVIQALVKQIVHLEDQLLDVVEKSAEMRSRIAILESKLTSGPVVSVVRPLRPIMPQESGTNAVVSTGVLPDEQDNIPVRDTAKISSSSPGSAEFPARAEIITAGIKDQSFVIQNDSTAEAVLDTCTTIDKSLSSVDFQSADDEGTADDKNPDDEISDEISFEDGSDRGSLDTPSDDNHVFGEDIAYSQMQNVQNMLINTQQMLGMDLSLASDSPKD